MWLTGLKAPTSQLTVLLAATVLRHGFTVRHCHIGQTYFDVTQCVVYNLVYWSFEPSQPLGIVSGLKETFIKRYTVERTNKARKKTGKTE